MFNFFRKRESKQESNDGSSLVHRTGLRIQNTDRVRQLIRYELFRHAEDNKLDTFDEADDFSLDDDEEWNSPYEQEFEPEPERAGSDQPGRSETQASVPGSPGSVAETGSERVNPQGGVENSQERIGTSST